MKLVKINRETQSLTLLNRFQFWYVGTGAWKTPSEWRFEIDRNCGAGCVIIEFGFFGITVLGKDCRLD